MFQRLPEAGAASLTLEVDGRRVRFRVEAWDGLDKISEGEHERTIVIAEKFHARLAEKKQRAGV